MRIVMVTSISPLLEEGPCEADEEEEETAAAPRGLKNGGRGIMVLEGALQDSDDISELGRGSEVVNNKASG